ncbi:hypothetical protein F503_01113 [Ophiostoma piceae UAMH 11346]|uniref:Subtilisin-like serine protease n=1 Tax=Ophiostoma piceae (strain UAMH 11346) TaxID=1262450 RepID=S3D4L5_OPHP1|nr:hypothetical protein F503_01113 [Ophiostoma piceae UAMH 11346]
MAPFKFPSTDAFDKLDDKSIPANAMEQLQNELACVVLDELYPHLDLVARKSGSHIDPLHVHAAKGRSIVVFEHARLHLVWHLNKVFLKPIPACLLRESFWSANMEAGGQMQRQAVGFMRTYAFLIQHQSDFAIAQREGLLPPAGRLTFAGFEAFIKAFRHAPDDEVSLRWHFGQLRLNWLDWAVRIFRPHIPKQYGGMLRQFYYEEQFHQTRQFLYEFGAQLLAVFAAVSLILSAIQVALAAKPDNPWTGFAPTSAWFSVVVIIFLVATVVLVGTVSCVVLMVQIGYGLRSRGRRVL